MNRNDRMEFPHDFEDFLYEYSFRDSDHVYTNGSELIQTFRVMQGYDHYSKQIQADTVDEFYNRLLIHKNEINTANYPWNFIELVAREMTKQLKENNNG